MNNKNDFLILACDGIWDVYTNQNAVASIYNTRKTGPKLSRSSTKAQKADPENFVPPNHTSYLIEKLMRDGMAKGWYEKPRGLGTDNMSSIVIRFKPGHADDAVLDPEPTEEEKAAEENGETKPVPEAEERKDTAQSNAVKDIMKE